MPLALPMLGVLDFEAFGAVGLALVTGPDPDLEVGFLAIGFCPGKSVLRHGQTGLSVGNKGFDAGGREVRGPSLGRRDC